jgi:chromate transporter
MLIVKIHLALTLLVLVSINVAVLSFEKKEEKRMILLTLAIVLPSFLYWLWWRHSAILPEMQHQVVEVHRWLTATEFSTMFAMAQAAFGPNMMIVPLVGWHVAGPAGLFVTSLAKFGPSSVLTIFALKFWNQFKDHPLHV